MMGGLEHIKIETRLINKKFPSPKGESVFLMTQVIFKIIRSSVVLGRIFPHLDLITGSSGN